MTAFQLRVTLPAPGVAEAIVGAAKLVTLPDAVPAPLDEKYPQATDAAASAISPEVATAAKRPWRAWFTSGRSR